MLDHGGLAPTSLMSTTTEAFSRSRTLQERYSARPTIWPGTRSDYLELV